MHVFFWYLMIFHAYTKYMILVYMDFFFVMPKEQDIFVGQLVLCLYWHVILIGA
jgi:phage shock protein PspC (stress-responsive transcriptional regulator)